MENKKEYCIYIICNGGKPYYISTYESIFAAKARLHEMIALEKERNRPYYVHNDFFENEYPAGLNCKIFCIKERDITDWNIYSELNEIKETTNDNKDNVIFLKNYI